MHNFRGATSKKDQKLQNWCNDTWKMVYRYVYSYVQNREEAEDITQETYSRALNSLPSRDNLPNNSYLKTIALNLVRDRWRRQKTGGIQVPIEDYMLSMDNLTDKIDTKNLIQQLMANLPDDYRTVLQLRIIQGFSRIETAKLMGRTEDAVRGLQFRAVQTLKTLVNQHFEEVQSP